MIALVQYVPLTSDLGSSSLLILLSLNSQEPGMLWIHTVSKDISDSVDDTEKKRQEVINELIYTERDFVRDLEYLRDVSALYELRVHAIILITCLCRNGWRLSKRARR